MNIVILIITDIIIVVIIFIVLIIIFLRKVGKKVFDCCYLRVEATTFLLIVQVFVFVFLFFFVIVTRGKPGSSPNAPNKESKL